MILGRIVVVICHSKNKQTAMSAGIGSINIPGFKIFNSYKKLNLVMDF